MLLLGAFGYVVLPVVRPWSQCHIRTTYAQTGAPVPPEEASDQQVPLATKDKKTEKTKQKHNNIIKYNTNCTVQGG